MMLVIMLVVSDNDNAGDNDDLLKIIIVSVLKHFATIRYHC